MIKRSTNAFLKIEFQRGTKGWDGDNLTLDIGVEDIFSGEPFGAQEYGGLRHFRRLLNN